MKIITFFYNLLWGDLIIVPLPGGSTLGLSLLVLILIPAGIYFTVRTKGLPFALPLRKRRSPTKGLSPAYRL